MGRFKNNMGKCFKLIIGVSGSTAGEGGFVKEVKRAAGITDFLFNLH